MRVLFVDDETEIVEDKSELIEDLGYECITADSFANALKQLYHFSPDIIFTDLKLPDGDGKMLIQRVKEFNSSIPVIVITGYATIHNAVACIQEGAFDYIEKPVSLSQLQSVLQQATKYNHEFAGNGESQASNNSEYCMPNIVGNSLNMKELAQRVNHVSNTDATVLIYGESGTGKELVARCIHDSGQRKQQPFIPLDCSTLPMNLMESELFGHERGAFTGAVQKKSGVIELAQHGTLFLDEITELDPSLQSKLLRFLQERQFRRVGGHESIKVDVRIVAATNENPHLAVEQKKLRQDLYYRLNVIPLVIPPLRERKRDIPLLVKHFINQYAPSSPYEISGITVEAMNCLKRYNWPGNVRELQNVIEQVISLISHERIELEDLPDELKLFQGTEVRQFDDVTTFDEFKDSYLKQAGKHYFEYVLKKCHGNISKAARMAGISRRTIYRLLEEYDVNY